MGIRLPVWVVLAVAALVLGFGVVRIRLFFRSDEEDQRARAAGGLYGLGRRTHLLFGIVYILMATYLILGACGVRLLGRF
jgi:hypothetical protein